MKKPVHSPARPSPAPVRIRKARKSDARALLRLIDALADYEKLKRPARTARERLIRDGQGSNRRYDAYLAFSGSSPVGYAIVFESYSSFLALPTLYLEDLFVLPESRKQRIGLALFRHCVGEALRRGCGRMEWVVLDWNEIAIRFYRRLGARHLKEWHTYRLVGKDLKRLAAR